MDGSCNGLQHYAALGRDEHGALAVNVIRAEDSDFPQDVYTIVLDEVVKKVQAHASGGGNSSSAMGNSKKNNTDDSDEATGLETREQRKQLALNCIKYDTLKRKTVKTTVMTIVYGVTKIGAQQQVRKRLEDQLKTTCEPELIKRMGDYLACLVLESVDEIFERAMQIKKWFDKVSEIFGRHGVPCSWMSPIGLAITQPYFEETAKEVACGLQRVKLKFKNVDGKVDTRHQKCGLPPNFVHSLDASHMMMVARKMMRPRGVVESGGENDDNSENSDNSEPEPDSESEPLGAMEYQERIREGRRTQGLDPDTGLEPGSSKKNFTVEEWFTPENQERLRTDPLTTHELGEGAAFAMVHDSFWTHACDVDSMNYHIREEFIRMHKTPILENLEDEFSFMVGEGKLPPLPPKAGLEIEKVRDSPYFFD